MQQFPLVTVSFFASTIIGAVSPLFAQEVTQQSITDMPVYQQLGIAGLVAAVIGSLLIIVARLYNHSLLSRIDVLEKEVKYYRDKFIDEMTHHDEMADKLTKIEKQLNKK